MKLQYFTQAEPDADDRILHQARAEGLVPPKCLLGGAVLQDLLQQPSPCARCYGPRERCGGGPRTEGIGEPRGADLAHIRGLLTGAK